MHLIFIIILKLCLGQRLKMLDACLFHWLIFTLFIYISSFPFHFFLFGVFILITHVLEFRCG